MVPQCYSNVCNDFFGTFFGRSDDNYFSSVLMKITKSRLVFTIDILFLLIFFFFVLLIKKKLNDVYTYVICR